MKVLFAMIIVLGSVYQINQDLNTLAQVNQMHGQVKPVSMLLARE